MKHYLIKRIEFKFHLSPLPPFRFKRVHRPLLSRLYFLLTCKRNKTKIYYTPLYPLLSGNGSLDSATYLLFHDFKRKCCEEVYCKQGYCDIRFNVRYPAFTCQNHKFIELIILNVVFRPRFTGNIKHGNFIVPLPFYMEAVKSPFSGFVNNFKIYEVEHVKHS